MTYSELISLCQPVRVLGSEPDRLGKLQQDSRLLNRGDLFIAVKGYQTDGHSFIGDALEKGASVIICEKIPEELLSADLPAAILEVENTRPLTGRLAQAFQGWPAKKLNTVAVTGTNGKTTVTTLVWQALHQLGETAGLLGTIYRQIGEERIESRLTTADPVQIASDMRRMVDAGCRSVIMEVSSHALDQQRTSGIEWQIAAFTNLSHDHLDYHESMESYSLAKRALFDSLDESANAIINMDSPQGAEMVRHSRAHITGFSFSKPADITCKRISSGSEGLLLEVNGTRISTPLTGDFNATNVAQAFLICRALGYEAEPVAEALATCTGAPGRLEKVLSDEPAGDVGPADPAVLVDYAHTPEALESVLLALKAIRKPEQPLIVVFGCGGDRDRAKRPRMARIAEAHADSVIVTSDNPRTEQPEQIIEDIVAGFSAEARWSSLVSRRDAITEAVTTAPGEAIVLIAGKGHETYQEVNGVRNHFDDRQVAREALNLRRSLMDDDQEDRPAQGSEKPDNRQEVNGHNSGSRGRSDGSDSSSIELKQGGR